MTIVNAQNPITYIMLIIVVVCLFIFIGRERKQLQKLELFENKYKSALNYTGTSAKVQFTRSVILAILTSVLFIILLFRPTGGVITNAEISTEELDIAFVVDNSLSMWVSDMDNNSRLDAAKSRIKDILKYDKGFRYSLVTYTTFPVTEVPLTTDLATIEMGVDTISIIKYSYSNGSSIAAGVEEAVKRLTSKENETPRKKVIILFTDGEEMNAEESIEKASQAARSKGIPVITFGMGTKAGGKVPYYKTMDGKTYYITAKTGEAISKLDENTLKSLASSTGGTYIPPGVSVDKVIPYLQGTKTGKTGTTAVAYKEIYHIFAGVLIVLILVFSLRLYEIISPRYSKDSTVKLKSVSVFLLPILFPVMIWLMLQGNIAYKNGNYTEAQKYYEQAAEIYSNDRAILMNMGNIYYKLKDYTKAIDNYQKATSLGNKEEQGYAYYDLGNSLYKKGEELLTQDGNLTIQYWEQAIKAYEEALKRNPNDTKAKENLEFVKKKLEELKKLQKEQQGNEGKEGNSTTDEDEELKRIKEGEGNARDRYQDTGKYGSDDKYKENKNDDVFTNPAW